MGRIITGLIALALACGLAAAPAAAQEGIGFWPGGSSGSNVNLDNGYEFLGFGADGLNVTVTASAAANALGTSATIGTTSQACAGLWLYAMPANSTARFQVDLSDDGFSTTRVAGLHIEPSSSGFQPPFWIPLSVASGRTISAKVQASSGSANLRLAIQCVKVNAQSPPMFSTMTALNVDRANTRAGTSVSLTASGDTTYTTLVASTGATYSAFMVVTGTATANPAQSQVVRLDLATGGSGSETVIWTSNFWASATAPCCRAALPLIETAVASNRISAKLAAVTPGSDAVQIGIYGFAP